MDALTGAAVSPRPLASVGVPVTARSAAQTGVRAAFGVLALGSDVVLRAVSGPAATDPAVRPPAAEAVDTVLAVAWGVARATASGADLAARVGGPVVGVLLAPPLVPRRLRARTGLDALRRRWRADRPGLARDAARVSHDGLPAVVDTAADLVGLDAAVALVLRRLDLDAAVGTALARIDLDEVVRTALAKTDVADAVTTVLADLDLDAVVAQVLDRLAVQALVERVLEQVAVDALVTSLVARLDLDGTVVQVLDRVDLQPLVDRVVAELDVPAIVDAALAQVDLTQIVVDKVDLGQVVNTALDDLDLTAIVMERVDLVGVADYLVDAIDLPQIIQQSTGSVAGEAVRGIRMQSVDADRAVSRLVDRFTLRGGRSRRLDAPGEPQSLATERRSDEADQVGDGEGPGRDGR